MEGYEVEVQDEAPKYNQEGIIQVFQGKTQ